MSQSESDSDNRQTKPSSDDLENVITPMVVRVRALRKRAPPRADSATDSENIDSKLSLDIKNEDSRQTSAASGTDSETMTTAPQDVEPSVPVKKRKRSRPQSKVKDEILKRHSIIKYELVHNMTKYTPDPENFVQFSNVREVTQFTTSAISQFLVEFAGKSERNIVDQQKDPTFLNLQSWSDYLNHVYGRPTSDSPAFLVKMIAETEHLPSPEKVDGVNYKDIYRTLAALMKGYPINDLDPLSKQVLADLYDELMADVHSETGKRDLEKMNELFLVEINNSPRESKAEQGSEHTFLDPELNPLQMPLEMLQRREDVLRASSEKWEMVPILDE